MALGGAELVLAGMAVSAATTTAAAASSAAAAHKNAKFYDAFGKRNAFAAEQDARAEEGRYRRAADNAIGRYRSKILASGAEVSGSPLRALSEAVADAEEQALLIRHGGIVGAQQARLNYGAAASNQRYQAGQSLLTGAGQAAGSILSGMGQAAAMNWKSGMTVPGNAYSGGWSGPGFGVPGYGPGIEVA